MVVPKHELVETSEATFAQLLNKPELNFFVIDLLPCGNGGFFVSAHANSSLKEERS